MTNLKVPQWALVLFCFFYCFSNLALAETSENLINPDAWQGATYGNDPGGCCASVSGSGALYDINTDTIMFSYGRDLLSQTIAINQALQLSGVQVDGYQYGWTYRLVSNSGRGGDTLIFDVTVRDSNGNVVEVNRYEHSNNGLYDEWQTESGTKLFDRSYVDPQSIALQIIGQDGGFWAGYYGPEVKDVMLNLIYTADPCAADPLYDSSCSGYAEAWAKQEYDNQCNANPLYDIGCPGYDQAYTTQQCSIDALYNPSCPGYADAYFNMQCDINPLYDPSCVGYATAYFEQQCTADPLRDVACSGYADAYFTLQCTANPLYDIGCNGYAEAYYTFQCTADPLYDSGCVGYETAYFETYIKPGLDAQVAEASGTSDEPSATASTDTSVGFVDPVTEMTSTPQTGDAGIDRILRDNTSPPVVVVEIAPPVVQPIPVETQSRSNEPQQETRSEVDQAEADMVAELEGNNEESSSDVEQQVGEDRKDDNQNDTAGVGDNSSPSGGANPDRNSPTDKQRQESKREKIKQLMIAKAKSLANDISKATSLEAQRQIQGQLLAAIGFNPDFTAYKQELVDAPFYEDPGMSDGRLPPQQRGLRNGLAQQILHDKMVDLQYNE